MVVHLLRREKRLVQELTGVGVGVGGGNQEPCLGRTCEAYLVFKGRDAVEKLNTEPGREVRAPKIEMSRSSARNVIKSHEVK